MKKMLRFLFALVALPGFADAMQSAVVIPRDLVELRTEILRQRGIACDFVESKRKQLLATSHFIPAPVAEGLNLFFRDPQVRMLFVDRYKTPAIGKPQQNRMAQDGGIRKALLAQNEIAYMRENSKQRFLQEDFDQLLTDVKSRYGLSVEPGNTFVLRSPLWGGFVVKIAKHRWIDNDAMVAFPYQLISRVFYNQEMNAFAEESLREQRIADGFCLLRKMLFHIPGTPEDLNDDNYAVVVPYIRPEDSLPLSSVFAKQPGGDVIIEEDFFNAVAALVCQIQHSGLWSIHPGNVFFLRDHRVVLLDTERPGMSGSEWRFFFHANQTEIDKNALGGLDGLADMLKSL